MDVLATITPTVTQSSESMKIDAGESPIEQTIPSIVPEAATIPDWLKESTSLNTTVETEKTISSSEVIPAETPVSEEISIPSVDIEETSENTAGLPDWLK